VRLSKTNLRELATDGLQAKLTKPKPLPYPSESVEQQALVRWFDAVCYSRWKLPKFALMAMPLQGQRTARNGARMKREGCRKGTLDMLLFVPKGAYSCLWIENKTPVGKVTTEQSAMSAYLWTAGAKVAFCFSCEDGIKAIEEYLS